MYVLNHIRLDKWTALPSTHSCSLSTHLSFYSTPHQLFQISFDPSLLSYPRRLCHSPASLWKWSGRFSLLIFISHFQRRGLSSYLEVYVYVFVCAHWRWIFGSRSVWWVFVFQSAFQLLHAHEIRNDCIMVFGDALGLGNVCKNRRPAKLEIKLDGVPWVFVVPLSYVCTANIGIQRIQRVQHFLLFYSFTCSKRIFYCWHVSHGYLVYAVSVAMSTTFQAEAGKWNTFWNLRWL